MKRTAVFTTAALSAASGIAVLLRRLMRPGGPVRAALADGVQGAGGSRLPAWRRVLPVTPVPGNAVTATTEVDEVQVARTWVLDGSSSWDGSPGERVRPAAPGKSAGSGNGRGQRSRTLHRQQKIRRGTADPQHGKQPQRHRPL